MPLGCGKLVDIVKDEVMSVEHFAEGSSEGRGDVPLGHTSLLGHTAPTPLLSDNINGDDSASRLYAAERDWQKGLRSNYAGPVSKLVNTKNSFISQDDARRLMHHTIFHANMDDYPNIEYLRNSENFNPLNDSRSGDVEFWRNSSMGRAAGRANPSTSRMFGSGFTVIHPNPRLEQVAAGRIRIHQLSDEDSHYLSEENLKENDGKVSVGTVTHELSHLLSSVSGNGTGHAWPLARTHLKVVRTAMGDKHADLLARLYKQHGVEYGDDIP